MQNIIKRIIYTRPVANTLCSNFSLDSAVLARFGRRANFGRRRTYEEEEDKDDSVAQKMDSPEDFDDFDDFEDDMIRKFNNPDIPEDEGRRRTGAIMKQKYFREPKNPNLLTYNEKMQIKHLHETDPEEWSPEKLAASFPATPDIISKIIKAKWTPTSEERIKQKNMNVARNWQLLAKNKLDISPKLKEHVQRFANRGDTVLCQANDPEFTKLPKPKEKPTWNNGEMLKVFTHYEEQLKMLQKINEPSEEITDGKEINAVKETIMETVSQHGEGKDECSIGYLSRYGGRSITLRHLEKSITRHAKAGKELPVLDRVIFEDNFKDDLRRDVYNTRMQSFPRNNEQSYFDRPTNQNHLDPETRRTGRNERRSGKKSAFKENGEETVDMEETSFEKTDEYEDDLRRDVQNTRNNRQNYFDRATNQNERTERNERISGKRSAFQENREETVDMETSFGGTNENYFSKKENTYPVLSMEDISKNVDFSNETSPRLVDVDKYGKDLKRIKFNGELGKVEEGSYEYRTEEERREFESELASLENTCFWPNAETENNQNLESKYMKYENKKSDYKKYKKEFNQYPKFQKNERPAYEQNKDDPLPRIIIPKDQWKKGAIFQVEDRFYSDNGRFLFRKSEEDQ